MAQVNNILKAGGKVIIYGMCDSSQLVFFHGAYHPNRTAMPKITFTMKEVLKNQQLISSYLVTAASIALMDN
jgi:hypothetical protein